jgi:hypothetical protein
MKKLIVLLLAMVILLAGCPRDADVASYNLSYEADQFKIFRRVVFYNGITDNYILVVEGYCSLDVDLDGDLTVTVKTEDGKYLKHFLGLSDNVTYFAEQLQSEAVSTGLYKVLFKPSVIIPDIEVK